MGKNIAIAILAAAVLAGGIYYFYGNRGVYIPPDTGIPTYPGAVNINADKFSARLKPVDRAKLVKVVIYETADEPAKVISFYKEQLKGKSEVLERSSRGIPSAVIRTQINNKPKLIVIRNNEDSGKTEISIGNIEEKPLPSK
jgi:hypothetical protein